MKALHKDFWMEIRKNKARFISIFCIVALGVAFFSGIQAASPDMRLSGDAYYDTSSLMDIKVVGTLGLTEEDVEALKEIKGVQEAEGAYSADAVCSEDDAQEVLHFESLNSTVNQLSVDEGRVPEKSGECFLDKAFAAERGYQVGDTLRVEQAEDSELLKRETFTIVGIGSSPLYISFNRGNTTLGSGEVGGFVYVHPSDFDQEVYTQIYLRVKGAEDMVSYTDAYDNLIEKIMNRVEDMEEERCRIRYEEVVSEAEEKLADAKKELEDGKKEAAEELAEAREKLVDGEKELADGKKEYEDGKQQLEDAKKELEDGRSQLEDAKKELEDGRSQLADAKAQVEEGWAELEPGRQQVAAGWQEYYDGEAELQSAKAELDQGKQQLADGKQQLEQAKNTLNEKQQELDAAKQQIVDGRVQIEETSAQLTAQLEQCQEGLAGLAGIEEQLSQARDAAAGAGAAVEEAQGAAAAAQAAVDQAQAAYDSAATEEEKAALQAGLDEANAALASADNALASANETYQTLAGQLQQLETAAGQKAALEESIVQIQAGLQEVENKRAELTAAEAEIEPGQQAIDQGWAELEEQEEQLVPAEEKIEAGESEYQAGLQKLAASKNELDAAQAQIYAGEEQLNSAQAQIDANEQKIAEGEQEIAENEQKLADGEKEIKENEEKLLDAEKELTDAEEELKDGWKEYEDGKKEAEEEIAEGEQEIADGEKEIEDLKMPEWLITDRNSLPEYSDYGDNADRIRNLGQVFPVIFFLVAALISLTTMTRMVEEQRTQIGTLKALGYGKYAIASKYLNYAFLATVGGSIAGIIIGEKILPYIIITAYGIMYHNMASSLQVPYELKYALIASAAAIVCTTGATFFSCYKELEDTPASLMRPPAPKEGKRVLIERVTFLWKHLGFTWKSTLRNLFRYKKRLFMTLFGISGSMALMLVGYGLKDSISDVVGLQYSVLQHYDATIIDDDEATDEEREELLEYLDSSEAIDHYTPVHFENMRIPQNKSSLNAYVYVPQSLENFSKDVTLRNRISGAEYELTDEGAVICEKTADLLGLEIGDEIVLERDNKQYFARIAVITENYMGHYVYMTPKVYKEAFGEEPDFSDIVITMKEEYKESLEETGLKILEYPAALSISYTRSIADQVERMISSLGMVTVVLIISAGMLAFVVLYNLNNINITERQRELATLKVLGFFDAEVSQYVMRENILLTLLSLVLGSGFGVLLHRFVIATVEVDAIMFGRNIRPVSFLYSALFTIAFSAIVNGIMHFKLKKIDMVESLKSVE